MHHSDPLCVVRVGTARVGVPTAEIVEVLDRSQPQPVPLTPDFVAGVIPYRGEILPVLRLHVMLRWGQCDAPHGVLVFSCPDRHEMYGVAIDAAEGIIHPEPGSWQNNPSTLDPLSMRLFHGSYCDGLGLILRLAPFELAPTRLMHSESFPQLVTNSDSEKECTR